MHHIFFIWFTSLQLIDTLKNKQLNMSLQYTTITFRILLCVASKNNTCIL